LVERNLAKVDVASSSLVSRSKIFVEKLGFLLVRCNKSLEAEVFLLSSRWMMIGERDVLKSTGTGDEYPTKKLTKRQSH
jgi:hypothetical protein